MESAQLGRPSSRDRSISDTFTMRPRTISGDPSFNGPSQRPDENRSPCTLPRGFESMLKTTTETGDIGMFSIKPSRVPQSSTPRRTTYNDNGLQRPRQTFQPFGVPTVDDRRRLPSYARDTTSEVISMYETASQKSASRMFDDHDYRSYSLNQTSYSAYKLSNHRSYTSLRSQQDGSGLLQRPRSPFAYPSRLKRPGFRPSSPALTDGGVIDYSRRAEIDRTLYVSLAELQSLGGPKVSEASTQSLKILQGAGHSTSSPSSLYAQKRKPPLSLRQEANRSTPSLLGQPSPPRRSPSPGLRRSNGNLANEWARRNGSSSNTSPARSTVSFASTANLYITASGTSHTTTPGKLAPSSPLYYDYTEDFEVESNSQPAQTLGSPIPFNIVKTIPEERSTSAERSPSTETRVHRLSDSLRPSRSTTPTISKAQDGDTPRRTVLSSEMQFEAKQSPLGRLNHENYPAIKQVDGQAGKKIVRLSGLGYGAQELSTHVEEVFGLPPTKSFEVSVSHNDSKECASGNTKPRVGMRSGNTNAQTLFTRGSSNGVGNFPPRFSSLPTARNWLLLADTIAGVERASILPTSIHGSEETGLARISESTAPSSTQSRFRSSSEFRSMDTGFTEWTDSIKTLEDSNKMSSPEKQPVTESGKTAMVSRTIADGSIKPNTNINHNITTPISSFSKTKLNDSPATSQMQLLTRNQPYSGAKKVEASSLRTYYISEIPAFSAPMAVPAIPRSGSPMLAPKPISPARQLKLKNSVPQLMKALPPLPPEPPVRGMKPTNYIESLRQELPCRVPPHLPEYTTGSTNHEFRKVNLHTGPTVPAKEKISKSVSEAGSEPGRESAIELPKMIQSPPRLKLKMKASTSLESLSSPDPVRIPCSGDESYPWAAVPDQCSPLPSAMLPEKCMKPKTPRFRLKITRASGSTYGTVRINRESGESKSSSGFHLRSPRDLFTSTAGIDHIFRQVSQHLHSRKASLASHEGTEPNTASTSLLAPNSYLSPKDDESPFTDLNYLRPQSPRPSPPPETRSVFSDDSSHIQGHGSVRGKLSSLRARIGVPYVNRIGSQSYDDITWRTRNVAEALPTPTAHRSASNLHTSGESTQARRLRRFAERMNHHRLKEKVRGWLKDFKEARSAFKSRVKARSASRSD